MPIFTFLGVDHTPARVALAKEARDAALRLAPERGETHLAAAWVAYHCYLDYETALTEVGIARRGLPNDAYVFEITAFITRRQGHWEQCTRNLERAADSIRAAWVFLQREPLIPISSCAAFRIWQLLWIAP